MVSVLGLTACKQEEGPAEKAGKKVDQTMEQAEKKIDKTVEQAEKKIEKAGDAISDQSKKAEEYMDDAAITAKVKAEIANDSILKVFQISVTTTNGVARLSGAVDSQQSIDRVLKIASNVKGVKSTENELVVKSGQ